MPFALAHGGQQIQIERTRDALNELGVGAEFMRWHDPAQTGDVLHFFGRIPGPLLESAQKKGMRIVVADLLGEQGTRPRWRLRLQKSVMQGMKRVLPPNFITRFDWDSYRRADACVAVTPYEGQLLEDVFGTPRQKIHVVANGVEDVFLQELPERRGQWLLCTGIITERKRVVEVAEAAILAQTPIWFVGRPYSESEPYARRFFELAQSHRSIIRYEGPIEDRTRLAQVYREARGFVLLSLHESLSLSALEAAACHCPLLLSDLPWARTTFDDKATYCPLRASTSAVAQALKSFYEAAPGLPVPPRPLSWTDIARQLKTVYETICVGDN